MEESRPLKSPFMENVRQVLRTRYYAFNTEKTYISWIYRFILFHNKKHPKNLFEADVVAFLSDLSVNRDVTPSTQSQALNALVFLYSKVLDRPLGELQGIVRAKKRQKIPVFLTTSEITDLFTQLEGIHWLAAAMILEKSLGRVKDA